MTLSNKLTISRILVTPIFVFTLSIDFPGNYLFALLIFLLAMLTDYLDGVLARSRGEVTKLGMFMDPLADKILVTSAFIIFVFPPLGRLREIMPDGLIPAWMAIVIVSREFAITGLRLVAAGQGVAIPAGHWGKHKTISQMLTVTGILVYLCLFYDSRADAASYRWIITVLAWITVVMTIFSGGYYLVHNYRYFREQGLPGENQEGREEAPDAE